ncbi:hypothetical protein ABKV19_000457, partial [Rosa sericea]
LRGFELLKAVHLEPIPFDIERDLMTPNFQTEKTAITQILQVDKLYSVAKGGKA